MLFIVTRPRRALGKLATPDFSAPQEAPSVPALRDVPPHDNPSAGSRVRLPVSEAVIGDTFHTEIMGLSSSAYHPYTNFPDASAPDTNNLSSFVPPSSLPFMIERAPLQALSSSNSRGEGFPSPYPAGVASYATARVGPSIPQTSARQEELFSSHLLGTGNSPEAESDGGGYSRSDVEGWRSTVGSPPPPSYHTRITQ